MGPKKTVGPKKTADAKRTVGPKRPAAKKSVAGETGAPAKTATPRKTTKRAVPRPTASAGAAAASATPRATPTEVFYPPTSDGYTPAPTPPVPRPAAAAPRYAPSYTPPPSYRPPSYRRPKRSSRAKGCMWGGFGLFFVLFVLPSAVTAFQSLDKHDGDASDTNGSSSTAAPCPGRIADSLPSGDGAELVTAFRTKNKQITLCRTGGGDLYYFGEFSDQREPGIAMPAEETSDGYEARNGPYSYRIADGSVTIYQNDAQIGRESLTPEPSPS
ncbi:hypothetical protein ACFWXA_33100 [Streptomyces atroolivaceus]|uniref:hypothetical protein n=1 Tax=Streptomyces atroolivaceus TaxID=66869 RepID=UPI00364BE6B4